MPELDIAQEGFCASCGTLDQALCLHELMRQYSVPDPDDEKCSIPWCYAETWSPAGPTATPLSLLEELRTVTCNVFSVPRTEGDAPDYLPMSMAPINCLLYADDVALIGTPNDVQKMLTVAKTHSNLLGYKWSPSKCEDSLLLAKGYIEPTCSLSRSKKLVQQCKAQNMCLRTCIRRPNATMGVVHIAALAALPNLFTRSRALQAKFLRRAETLLSVSFVKALTTQLDLSKEKTTWGELRRSVLWKKAQLLKEHQPRLKDPLKEAYVLLCQKEIDMQLASVNRLVTVARGLCKSVWDLILLLPCTRSERCRLIKWQIAWLPPTPSVECQCGAIKGNRNHILLCPTTITFVQKLWSLIDPAPPPEVYFIDYALNCLPRSFKSPGTWCDWWPCLLALLRAVDPTTSSYKLPEEKAHGQILIDLAAKFRATKPTRPHRILPPTQEPVPGDPFPHLLSEISTVPRQPPPSVPARNCA
ncbi:hypothetical protein PHYBLDRAFT_73155 [Phycomyces blakesleeanus NRRL 1555(-)]|uniref:Uncharacterized protein n=1 Tax=Phycomyces blakesleeanus (strain ATCC 8743b / DSM 1359 / FGSC 10004 / NBRC 33097 / NRRL 1555) TaxID=763407 RepID=A0A162WBU1_PHYB8|nr:hypothetical protein PHYBLDRAFT_73155 [Phycomyces blakesleeanus NRRL 1555(-)]OAD66145.1 hypothetical protein PHYBLDRAFT_73155 [Phycomyces blakesleeanus NRRL 1555(-)]|eukprot:XP_018284185.1 hypothetical protein PHYBLDRAFT_73155 [Phycomyces blakesleeanus NRRL 1555(-)]